MPSTLRESLDYEPRSLSFGTSGLRGLVTDLTQLEVVINTLGFLRFLANNAQIRAGDAVCLGGDLRPSTAGPVAIQGRKRGEILQGILWAVTNAGYRPTFLGALPTPALMLAGMSRGQASIMVTGSHIPFDRNGIKFNKPTGEVLKSDEPEILEQVRAVREALESQPAGESPFDLDGQLKTDQRPTLPPPDLSAGRAYLQRYADAFPRGVLDNRRILLYEHSAVGRDLLAELLGTLGATVIPAGRSETFIPIDTEAVQPAMLRGIQELVDAHGGAELDAVVSLDGDSDRPLLLGLDGGRVRFLGGDLLGIVVADFLGARHVAVPISANDAVDRFFSPRGVSVVKTRIGSPYVIAAMREVGWEANGGFLTACPCRVPSGGTLSALPTRDAFLPLLAALYASLGHGLRLVDHFARLPERFGQADVIRDFPREISLGILARFNPRDPSLEEAWFESATPEVRLAGSSDRQPASPEQAEDLQRKRAELEAALQPHLGSVRVAWLNVCDGLRFANTQGEILHFRPSGNAPEQRIYAVADSGERAATLIRSAVEPGGILDVLRGLAATASNGVQPFASRPWLRLQGVVQHYAWGGNRFIPELIHAPNPEQRPYAELWFGSHPSAPSLVQQADRRGDLRQILHDEAEAILGQPLVARFGTELPYLLKILDARQMLSIQTHPDRTTARAGFERENAAGIPLNAPQRNYKDPHPKPEVHVALTPFWLLHGFRPLEELLAEVERTTELARAWPMLRQDLAATGADATGRRRLLQRLYEHVMRMPQPEVNTILQPLVDRLTRDQPTDKHSPDFWAHRAAGAFTREDGGCDRGLFSIYLLNLVYLEPGQSTFQDAGVLHAYLEGSTAELMACSDNVMRGGLTPKHVDVEELLQIVRFEEGPPQVSRGELVSDGEWVFPSNAVEFELRRLAVAPGLPRLCRCSTGPECLLTIEGEVRVCCGPEEATLERGACLLLPADRAYELASRAGSSTVLRARLPM